MYKLNSKKNIKQKGFNLIELMIASMLGIIVTGGAISMYISSIKASADIAKSARLNYDLDTTMQLMVNDIRRAGYWGGAQISTTNDNLFLLKNPFSAADTTLSMNTAGDCILYSYDVDDGDNTTNPDLPDGIVNNDEYYGFKLVQDTDGIGVIKIRQALKTTNDCDNDSGSWEAITDPDTIDVTYLKFSFLPITAQTATNTHPALPALIATSRCLNSSTNPAEYTNSITCATENSDHYIAQRRIVNIHLSGYVKGDNDVLKSLSTTVQVRNDRLYQAP